MLESIWKETILMEWTAPWHKDGDMLWWLLAQGLISIPTVIYAALVWLANQLYRKLATKLTEWGIVVICFLIFLLESPFNRRKPSH